MYVLLSLVDRRSQVSWVMSVQKWHAVACCDIKIHYTGISDVCVAAGAGVDIAEFSGSSSDKTVSVVRGNTAIIDCHVPASVPSAPVISYLRDGHPFTLTCMLAFDLLVPLHTARHDWSCLVGWCEVGFWLFDSWWFGLSPVWRLRTSWSLMTRVPWTGVVICGNHILTAPCTACRHAIWHFCLSVPFVCCVETAELVSWVLVHTTQSNLRQFGPQHNCTYKG